MPVRDTTTRLILASLLFLYATAAFAQSASVSIGKVAAPNPVAAGQDLTYDVTASNEGPSDASTVVMNDPLPAGTTFASLAAPGGWICTTPTVGTNGTVNCTTPTFTPGSVDFIVVVHTDPTLANGSTLSNTATISSTTPDPRPSDNTFTVDTGVQSVVDLGVTKSSVSTVTAGLPLTYTIGYSASGPSVAHNVAITDALPAGTTFTSITATGWNCSTPAVGTNGTITCTLPSLGVGGSGSISLTVGTDPTLSSGSMLSNTVTISGDVVDGNSANDSATKIVTTTASSDVSVTKNAGTAVAGGTVTYTIGYGNAGPSTATSLSLTDPLPAGTTFSSITAAGWSCTTPSVGANGTVNCTMTSLAPAGSGTITLVLNVTAATTGTLTNTATISGATPDPNNANNSSTNSTTVTTNADLGVTITGAPNPDFSSSPLTYTVTVTRTGPSNANNATLTVALSPLTNFASITPAAGWSCSTPAVGATGSVSCTHPSFSGASALFTIGTITNASLTNASIVTTANVSSASTDPNPANNSATATTIVTGPLPTLSPQMLLLLAIALAMAGWLVKPRV
jgi:uncharacterized repeat protein (TIGR01451 family)